MLVRLDQAGALHGEVLLDPLGTRVHLSLLVRERRTGAVLREQVSSGPFALESVTPGTHDVSLRLAGIAEPLAIVADVVIDGGETTTLSPIDLRGVLRKSTFRVVDENGAPLADASALMVANVGTEGRMEDQGVFVRDGTGVVVTTARDIDLLVFATDRRAELVRSLRDGQQIPLTPRPVVRVQVPIASLPQPPVALRVQLEPLDEAFPTRALRVARRQQDELDERQSSVR